jgi:predicted TIM-barrel fold metal-dependent hydrolase
MADLDPRDQGSAIMKFYMDALPLSEEDRRKIFETNARRVYRLDRTDLFKRRG